MKSRTTRLDDFAEGSVRFVYGLSKKVVIADTLAPVADAAFDNPAGDLSMVGAWIGLLAYAFQIYFDFSGYSDMAVGLGRMFGFHFPENFRRPYSALSVTDFWRRWHITLSNWFRDYLYVPLGGNRGTARRTSINLIIVFLATGIWHGANWTFLVWCMVHGGVMLWERARRTGYVDKAPNEALARARTFLIVLLAWVFFRDTSLSDAVEYFGALAGQGAGFLTGDIVLRTIDAREAAILAFGLATLLLPRTFFGGRLVTERSGARATTARVALMGVALPVTLLLIVAGTFSPFLYFQF
jgi:alginate O-acetyltransferase complex protein AlgI